jgi:hypothetical protein
MPETPVHENDLGAPAKDEIRTARQFAVVEAIAIAFREDEPTHEHLRTGVL